MEKPNLFNYATKELSQDAFICWLLAWADKSYESDELHQLAKKFLETLFSKFNLNDQVQVESVQIVQQFKKIDVLCLINLATGLSGLQKTKSPSRNSYAIIIEDKVGTSQHGNQLQNYFDEVKKLGFSDSQILRVYLKTRDQAHYKKIEEAGYKPYTRRDFLEVLTSANTDNQILVDFRTYWLTIDNEINGYKLSDVWGNNAWIGFYKALSAFYEVGSFGRNTFGKKSSPTYGGFIAVQKKSCLLYVQICKERLNLKIRDIPENYEKKSLRDQWIKRLSGQMLGGGIQIKKPRRGLGKAMVVGYIENYLVKDKDLVDLNKTVEYLKVIEQWLSQVEIDS